MKKSLLVAFVFINLLSSCKKEDNPFLIVPGKGVGGYTLGDKLQNIDYNNEDFDFLFNKEDSLIISIDVLSSKYYTKKGIKIGDSYEDVIKAYGKPKKKPTLQKGNRAIKSAQKKKYPYSTMYYKQILYFISQEDGIVNKIRVYQ